MQTALSVDTAGLELYALNALLTISRSDVEDALYVNIVGTQFSTQKLLFQMEK